LQLYSFIRFTIICAIFPHTTNKTLLVFVKLSVALDCPQLAPHFPIVHTAIAVAKSIKEENKLKQKNGK